MALACNLPTLNLSVKSLPSATSVARRNVKAKKAKLWKLIGQRFQIQASEFPGLQSGMFPWRSTWGHPGNMKRNLVKLVNLFHLISILTSRWHRGQHHRARHQLYFFNILPTPDWTSDPEYTISQKLGYHKTLHPFFFTWIKKLCGNYFFLLSTQT